MCAYYMCLLQGGGGGGEGRGGGGGGGEGGSDYRLGLVEFGCHEMSVWYASPYPPDFTCLPKIFLCQFCLKYFKSSATLHRHAVRPATGLHCVIATPPVVVETVSPVVTSEGTPVIRTVGGLLNPHLCS